MRTTINDVAKEAGVSISTVSRVINGNYPVNVQTRARVETAAAKLNYTPNTNARNLKQSRTMTIGVITPSLTNSFFTLAISAIQDYFQPLGYRIILSDSGGSVDMERAHAKSMMEYCVDGLISIDPRSYVLADGVYDKLHQTLPLVLLNGYSASLFCHAVYSMQEQGAQLAMEHLFELGHRRIAFLRGRRSSSYDIKERVYRQYLSKNGLEPDTDLILYIPNGNAMNAQAMAEEEVKKLLAVPGRATALFACNDMMAAGALMAAKISGMSVPEDFSVIGFDNTVVSQLTSPKLTTIDQHPYGMGLAAAERLYSVMTEPPKMVLVTEVMTELVVRESTGPAKK